MAFQLWGPYCSTRSLSFSSSAGLQWPRLHMILFFFTPIYLTTWLTPSIPIQINRRTKREISQEKKTHRCYINKTTTYAKYFDAFMYFMYIYVYKISKFKTLIKLFLGKGWGRWVCGNKKKAEEHLHVYIYTHIHRLYTYFYIRRRIK